MILYSLVSEIIIMGYHNTGLAIPYHKLCNWMVLPQVTQSGGYYVTQAGFKKIYQKQKHRNGMYQLPLIQSVVVSQLVFNHRFKQ
jgi:hypothetical protein